MSIERFDAICREECGLHKQQVTLVGVSGGPDSLCLLDLLARSGYSLVVAHFNHALRPEAEQEARQVQVLAAGYGLPFVSDRQDVHGLAEREHLSLEAAARKARYRFLFAQARQVGAQAVATGHTADDQVETVLMHLLRGAGLEGLTGMDWRRTLPEWDASLPLVRPLLGWWREETLHYCQEQGLSPSMDSSNQDTAFTRNRLRHELIPMLESYNPQVKEALWRLARSLAGDAGLLELETGFAWERCDPDRGQGYASLSLVNFRLLPRAMQRRVLRRLVGSLRPGLRDLDFETVERGIEFACEPGRSNEIDLALGLWLRVSDNRLFLSDGRFPPPTGTAPRMGSGQELSLKVPGQVELDSGWQITAEELGIEALEAEPGWKDDRSQGWLDADTLRLPLRIRTPRPADRFQPLGLAGHTQKLSDFWINERLPRPARSGWPLVFSGETLAWVPMFRPGEPFRVRETTRRVVRLRIMKRTGTPTEE